MPTESLTPAWAREVTGASRVMRRQAFVLKLVLALLAGYAFLGKTVAALGFPPLYVGEITLFICMINFLAAGHVTSTLTALPMLFLAFSLGWVTLRTLPFMSVYAFDALRDSVVLTYGLFAFAVVGIVLHDVRLLGVTLNAYRRLIRLLVPISPLLVLLSAQAMKYDVVVPGLGVPFPGVKAGEAAVHVCGAFVFLLAGFASVSRLRMLCAVATTVIVSSLSRGAMLAILVPVVFAFLAMGMQRSLMKVAAAGVVLFSLAYMAESVVQEYRPVESSTERPISARQLVENAASVLTESDRQTEGTKTWRTEWWKIIIEKTVYGPYFWSGRGFGLNIAYDDGFSRMTSDAPLRSPHNVHMTILARSGVPGLVLWSLTLLTWYFAMLRAMVLARRAGALEWSRLFLFVTCYLTACLIDSSFDVALEGPMEGIWFWFLFGFGVACERVYRAGSTDLGRPLLPPLSFACPPPARH